MHAISFLAKRLHLVTTAFGQHVLRDIAKVDGMTPARFDLLCLMRQPAIALQEMSRESYEAHGGPWPGRDEAIMTQRAIVRRLALHPSTVSKLVKRLREMGWVKVTRDYDDKRVKVVEATPLGLRRIWEAMRRVFRGRAMLAKFERIHKRLRPSIHVVDAIDETHDLLSYIARFFGDRSDVVYHFGSRAQQAPE